MFNRNIAILIFLILLFGIFIAIFPNGDHNNTTNTPSNSNYDLKEQVQVSYNGSWNGSIPQGYSSNKVRGTGNMVYDVTGKIVSASFQKQDAGNGNLTINFLYNGNIVNTARTPSINGIAQTAYTF